MEETTSTNLGSDQFARRAQRIIHYLSYLLLHFHLRHTRIRWNWGTLTSVWIYPPCGSVNGKEKNVERL